MLLNREQPSFWAARASRSEPACLVVARRR